MFASDTSSLRERTGSFDNFPMRIMLSYPEHVSSKESTQPLKTIQPLEQPKRRTIMPIKNPRELFVHLLSNVRQGTERTTKLVQEFTQQVQDTDIREALEARIFVSQKILDTLDQCFKIIGEQPVRVSGRLYDAFVEDFRSELAEIQNPTVRNLFVLAKASQVLHLRIAEYRSLVAAADLSGHFAVGVLLESCLADKLAFVERTSRLLRYMTATKMAEKIASKAVA
jgi:ferritin-like metal-binding protein YciE